VHADADRVSEVGVERHPRCERDGIVGIQPHDERDGSRRNAGSEEHALGRHARLRENLRVHDDDTGHGHERCEPAEQFTTDGGLIFGELEITIDQRAHVSPERR
jgi:hypothetical protein